MGDLYEKGIDTLQDKVNPDYRPERASAEIMGLAPSGKDIAVDASKDIGSIASDVLVGKLLGALASAASTYRKAKKGIGAAKAVDRALDRADDIKAVKKLKETADNFVDSKEAIAKLGTQAKNYKAIKNPGSKYAEKVLGKEAADAAATIATPEEASAVFSKLAPKFRQPGRSTGISKKLFEEANAMNAHRLGVNKEFPNVAKARDDYFRFEHELKKAQKAGDKLGGVFGAIGAGEAIGDIKETANAGIGAQNTPEETEGNILDKAAEQKRRYDAAMNSDLADPVVISKYMDAYLSEISSEEFGNNIPNEVVSGWEAVKDGSKEDILNFVLDSRVQTWIKNLNDKAGIVNAYRRQQDGDFIAEMNERMDPDYYNSKNPRLGASTRDYVVNKEAYDNLYKNKLPFGNDVIDERAKAAAEEYFSKEH